MADLFVASFGGISVDDLAKAKRFYGQTLGLKLIDDTMGLMYELPGHSQLFIYEKPDHQPASFTVLNLVVEDIDQAVTQLTAKGVVFEHYELGKGAEQDDKAILRGRAAHMGPDIAWFRDPAGNVLSVLQD